MEVSPDMIDPALTSGTSSTMDDNRPSTANCPDDEDDPVVATYNIFLKPSLPTHRKVMILEHTNKSDGKKPARAPLEIRLKPTTGMVEVDYPMDYNGFYDRSKGLSWGTNLHKRAEVKQGGSHGLAGGFGVGQPPPRASASRRQDDMLDPGMDWAEALRKDYVLRTQTLGGQMPDTSQESKYMVGVFAGRNLHLTPATSLVHLRPRLHHIDATAESERLSTARGTAAAGAAATKDAARAIHMTIKQNNNGDEEIVQETMADRLKKVQLEGWKKMRYVHDEASDSWAMAEEALYLRSSEPAEGGSAPPPASETPDMAAVEEHGMTGLVDKVASLRTGWDEDEMLETTSGIKKEGNIKIDISDDEPPAAEPSASAKAKGKAKATGPAKATTSSTTAKVATRGKRATTNSAKAGPSEANK